MIKAYTFVKPAITAAAKPVVVKPHKRSTPSPIPRKNPDQAKPGPKTVVVKPHRRSKPD